MSLDIIDADLHGGLNKYRPVADVRAVLACFGVAHAVLVQHLGEYDNTYIRRIVSAAPERFAGVFLIDTDADDASDQLARWAEGRIFRGIRLLARSLDSRSELWEQAAALGLNIVAYEEPTLAKYVDSLSGFLRDHPDARLVLSHFGVLDRREAPRFQSYDAMLSMADLPNAFLQVSGMHMFREFPYVELVPLVRRALAAFGPARLLYGSNYPVMKEDAAYGQELRLFLAGRLGVPANALAPVMGGTARTVWFDRCPLSLARRS